MTEIKSALVYFTDKLGTNCRTSNDATQHEVKFFKESNYLFTELFQMKFTVYYYIYIVYS